MHFPDYPAITAFPAFKLQRRMPDPKRFEPVLDHRHDLFQGFMVGLAAVHMGVKDIDVRAQRPEMDVVDAGYG